MPFLRKEFSKIIEDLLKMTEFMGRSILIIKRKTKKNKITQSGMRKSIPTAWELSKNWKSYVHVEKNINNLCLTYTCATIVTP